MGVFSTNIAEITSGGLISSSHASDIYGVLSGSIREDFQLSGSLIVTGSVSFQTANISNLTSSIVTITTATVTSASIGNITNNIGFAGTASMSDVTTNTFTTMGAAITSGSVGRLVISGSLLIYTGSIPVTDPNVAGAVWASGSQKFLMLSTG